MQLSYHVPIELNAYLKLSRWDRFALHQALSDWIDEVNEMDDAASVPTRAERKGGVY